jgi:hypothetical protein
MNKINQFNNNNESEYDSLIKSNNITESNSDSLINIKAEFTDFELTTTQEKRDKILIKGLKLNSFTKRNINTTHINSSMYHLLLDPFTIDNAYKNLSKK